MNVLLLGALMGNGGITSWTKKYIKDFPNDEFKLFPIKEALSDKVGVEEWSKTKRAVVGLQELKYILDQVKDVLRKDRMDIFHTTTSGSLGSLRDYVVGKYCHKKGMKTVMHCRYGCMPDMLKSRFWKYVILKSMKHYDQVWVLDSHTFNALKQIPETSDKVRLTPNCIRVPEIKEIPPKSYQNIAFIANIYKQKGIFELIEAFKKAKANISLHIVGPASEEIKDELNSVIEGCGEKIKYYGPLANADAVLFLEKMDGIALPTYYPSEAFPISIIEAMSRAKLVISTRRAAINDMLTARDGSNCGIFVREQNIEDLVEALEWIDAHHNEADELCRKAYDKVLNCYDTDVVYDLYRTNYRALFN